MSVRLSLLIGALVAVGAYIGSGYLAPNASRDAKRTFGPPTTLVQLSNPQINESSGIARSHRYPGLFYTHNDSGDSARFWRFDGKGAIVGPISVSGAQAFDWEDMASARLAGKDYLYFADIGDNARIRKSIRVYRVEEPAPGVTSVPCDVFELSYPDGAHNAEAFGVHPSSGDFVIVEKSDVPRPRAYRLRAPKPGTHTLELLGELQMPYAQGDSRLVTGGDLSADGRFFVVRTYQAGYEFEFGASLESLATVEPVRIRLASEIQGEAIGYSVDGQRLLTTSEFAPCRVSLVPIDDPSLP